MYQHHVQWTGSTSGSMPDPVVVKPVFKFAENIFKTKGGKRRRKRKGIWLGAQIEWVLDPSELTSLNSLLSAENGDSDSTPFSLSLDGGATYRRAQLSREPKAEPPDDTNVAVKITLEFEFYDRQAGFPSPIHLGAP